MALQGTIEDQAQKSGVLRILLNGEGSDRAEYLPVILGFYGFFGKIDFLRPPHSFLDNGPVEGFFTGKILEHQRLADAQAPGNLSRGRPPETLLGEKLHGSLENLFPPIPCGHPSFHRGPFLWG